MGKSFDEFWNEGQENKLNETEKVCVESEFVSNETEEVCVETEFVSNETEESSTDTVLTGIEDSRNRSIISDETEVVSNKDEITLNVEDKSIIETIQQESIEEPAVSESKKEKKASKKAQKQSQKAKKQKKQSRKPQKESKFVALIEKMIGFQKMKIQKKIWSIVLIAITMTGLASIVALALMIKISVDSSAALENYGFATGDAASAMMYITDSRRCVRDIVNFTDARDVMEAQSELFDIRENFTSHYDKVKATVTDKEGKILLDDIDLKYEQYKKVQEEAITVGLDNTLTAEEVNQEMLTVLDPAYDSLYEAFEKLLEAKRTTGREKESELLVLSIVAGVLVVVTIILAVFLSLAIARNAARNIAQPLQMTVEAADKIVAGELDVELDVHTQDEVLELSQSFKEMSDNLKMIIEDIKILLGEMAQGNFDIHTTCEEKYVGGYAPILQAIREIKYSLSDTLAEISESTSQFTNAASNMAESSEGLAEGATEQASTVDALLKTAESVNFAVEKSSENVRLTNQKMGQVADMADESKGKLNDMMDAMTKINDASKAIEVIIATIEEIATQTNLLALNASIEAARAGEVGKGFAVVAGEIGKLANDSTNAVEDTRKLIKAALDEVSHGKEITDVTVAALQEMVEQIHDATALSEQMQKAAEEQASAMKEINEGIEKISSVVESNSATAEQTSAMSEELSAQAETLGEMVSRFNLS